MHHSNKICVSACIHTLLFSHQALNYEIVTLAPVYSFDRLLAVVERACVCTFRNTNSHHDNMKFISTILHWRVGRDACKFAQHTLIKFHMRTHTNANTFKF